MWRFFFPRLCCCSVVRWWFWSSISPGFENVLHVHGERKGIVTIIRIGLNFFWQPKSADSKTCTLPPKRPNYDRVVFLTNKICSGNRTCVRHHKDKADNASKKWRLLSATTELHPGMTNGQASSRHASTRKYITTEQRNNVPTWWLVRHLYDMQGIIFGFSPMMFLPFHEHVPFLVATEPVMLNDGWFAYDRVAPCKLDHGACSFWISTVWMCHRDSAREKQQLSRFLRSNSHTVSCEGTLKLIGQSRTFFVLHRRVRG